VKVFFRFEKRIYIPLPGIEARKRMFELHVGTTPCELSQKDYRVLAERTEGSVVYHCPVILHLTSSTPYSSATLVPIFPLSSAMH
jgi:SpoVK/Ycf46/Vps4 family AAA+-type ATPase